MLLFVAPEFSGGVNNYFKKKKKKTTYNIITALVQHFFNYELTGRIRVIPKPNPINSGSR